MTYDNMTIEQFAKEYSFLGIRIFPVHGVSNGACTCGRKNCAVSGKHPIERGWRDSASNDPNTILGWLKKYPDMNIGILTGAPNGFTVIDVDPRNGGYETLKVLEKKFDLLPRDCLVSTGGGGLHFIIEYIKGLKSKPTWKGIDIKNDGGFIVAAPSRHSSGNQYEWRSDPKRMTSPPKLNKAWSAEFSKLCERKFKTSDEWTRVFLTKVTKGSRNETLASIVGYLMAHNLDVKIVLILVNALNNTLFSPPLDQVEMLGVTASIVRRHRKSMMTEERNL